MKSVARGLFLAVLLCVEFVLFRGFVAREIAPQPPRNHDQSVYLREAYRIYRQASDEGVGTALSAAVARSGPTGLLYPIEGASLCLVAGPSRASALSVNFLVFALLQVAVFTALVSTSDRPSFACFGLGLVLLARSPFFWAGGLTDFRIDLVACGLYGVFLAAVLRSRVFTSRAWSIVAGLSAAVCILNRYLTIAYFAGLAVAFLSGVVILAWSRDGRTRWPRSRVLSVLLAAGSALLVSGPVLWTQRRAIWQYYVIGHFGGDGATRARAVGIGAGLFYYPRSIVFDHPGPAVLLAILAAAAGVFVFARGSPPAGSGDRNFFREGVVFLSAAFAVPFILLARDPDKSPVVGSILVPPLLLLSLWLLADRSGFLPGQSAGGGSDRFWTMGGPGLFAVGFLVFVSRLTWAHPGPDPGRQEVIRLHDVATDFVRREGWKLGVVSSDRIDDAFDANTLTVYSFEREGLLRNFETGLPAGIHAVEPNIAYDVVRRSRFVLLTESETRSGGLPYDRSMRPLAVGLSSVCREAFVPLGTFQLPERTAVLWARRGP
ncbi:MAG: hypothetical protein ABI584_11140 [Acidobacteriota bacterium]